MSLLVGDVVTNFIANTDQFFAKLDTLGKRLDALGKRTVSLKVDISNREITGGIRQIASGIDRLNSAVSSVQKLILGAAAAGSKAVRKSTGVSSKLMVKAANDVKVSISGASKVAEKANSTWVEVGSTFLKVGGILSALAFATIPKFTETILEGSNTVTGLAGVAEKVAESSENVVGKAIFGVVAVFLKGVGAIVKSAQAGLGKVAGFFGTLIGGTILWIEQLTGASAALSALSASADNVFSTIGRTVDFVFRTFVGNVGIAIATIFGLNSQLARTTTFMQGFSVATAALSNVTLALFGLNFMAGRLLKLINVFHARDPNTVLGRAAVLINVLFTGLLSLVSPLIVIMNRLFASVALLSTVASITTGIIAGWGTLAVSVTVVVGLVAGLRPLLTNAFLIAKLRLLQVAAVLGVGKAQFLLFLRGMRESFLILQRFVSQLSSLPRSFNILKAAQSVFNTLKGIQNTLSAIFASMSQGLSIATGMTTQSEAVATNLQTQLSTTTFLNKGVQSISNQFTDMTAASQRFIIASVNGLNFVGKIIPNVLDNTIIGIARIVRNGVSTMTRGVRTRLKRSRTEALTGWQKLTKDFGNNRFFGFVGRAVKTGFAVMTKGSEDFRKRYDEIWEPARQKRLERTFDKIKNRIEEQSKTANKVQEGLLKIRAKLVESIQDELSAFKELVKVKKKAIADEAKAIQKQKTAKDTLADRSTETKKASGRAGESRVVRDISIQRQAKQAERQLDLVEQQKAGVKDLEQQIVKLGLASVENGKITGRAFGTVQSQIEGARDLSKNSLKFLEKVKASASEAQSKITGAFPDATKRRDELKRTIGLVDELIKRQNVELASSKIVGIEIIGKLKERNKVVVENERLQRIAEGVQKTAARNFGKAAAQKLDASAKVTESIKNQKTAAEKLKAVAEDSKNRIKNVDEALNNFMVRAQENMSKASKQLNGVFDKAAELLDRTEGKSFFKDPQLSKGAKSVRKAAAGDSAKDAGKAVVDTVAGQAREGRRAVKSALDGATADVLATSDEFQAIVVRNLALAMKKLSAFGSAGATRFEDLIQPLLKGDAQAFIVGFTRNIDTASKLFGQSIGDFQANISTLKREAKELPIVAQTLQEVADIQAGVRRLLPKIKTSLAEVETTITDNDPVRAAIKKLQTDDPKLVTFMFKFIGESLLTEGNIAKRTMNRWMVKLVKDIGSTLSGKTKDEVNEVMTTLLTDTLSDYIKPGSDPKKFPISKILGKLMKWAGESATEAGVKAVDKMMNSLVGPKFLKRVDFVRDSGKKIIALLVEGLKSGGKDVVSALDEVLKQIKKRLPQSNPLLGPLAGPTLQKAGGKIIKLLSLGILSGEGILGAAMGKVLAAVTLPLLPGGILIGAVTSGTRALLGFGQSLLNLTKSAPVQIFRQLAKSIRDVGFAAARADMSERVGEFDQFRQAVTTLGVESSQLESVFITMRRRLAEAASGTLEAREQLAKFNISAEEVANGTVSLVDVFRQLVIAFEDNAGNAKAQQEILDLTGASFGNLFNVIAGGSEKLEGALDAIGDVSEIIDQDAVQRATEMAEGFARFDLIVQGIKRTILEEFFPTLQGWMKFVTSWWVTNRLAVITGIMAIGKIAAIWIEFVVSRVRTWTTDAGKFFTDLNVLFVALFELGFAAAKVFFNNILPLATKIFGAFGNLMLPGVKFAFNWIIRVGMPHLLSFVLSGVGFLGSWVIGGVAGFFTWLVLKLANWIEIALVSAEKFAVQATVSFVQKIADAIDVLPDAVISFLGLGKVQGAADFGGTVVDALDAQITALQDEDISLGSEVVEAAGVLQSVVDLGVAALSEAGQQLELELKRDLKRDMSLIADSVGTTLAEVAEEVGGALHDLAQDVEKEFVPIFDDLVDRLGIAQTVEDTRAVLDELQAVLDGAESIDDRTKQQANDAIARSRELLDTEKVSLESAAIVAEAAQRRLTAGIAEFARTRADAMEAARAGLSFFDVMLGTGQTELIELKIKAAKAEMAKTILDAETNFEEFRRKLQTDIAVLAGRLGRARDKQRHEEAALLEDMLRKLRKQMNDIDDEVTAFIADKQKELDETIKTLEEDPFRELGDSAGSAIGAGIKDTLDAMLDPDNPKGFRFDRLIGAIFTNLRDSLLDNFIESVTKELQDSMTTMFKEVFAFAGDLAGSLASAVMFVVSSLLAASEDSLNATQEQITDVIETTERVRGIISGETTIKLKEVGDSLRDAMEPTNDILRGIREDLRQSGSGRTLEPSLAGTSAI